MSVNQSLTTIGGITAYRVAACTHESRTAVQPDNSPALTRAYECDACGNQDPFTSDDYAFALSQYWAPRAPAGVSPLAWIMKSYDDKIAHLTARAN